jgi:membrane protein YqaA with SNARE-associated domain
LIHKLLLRFQHWEVVLLAFLKPLGFWSVGVLAAIDASSLAIPMDLIIAGYVWSDRERFWIYALVGALGASVGALVPFYIGRAGGEWVLEKRMDSSKFAQMRARFDRHHWFAVMVPAAMPPPFPFKLFAFGAGVFDMQVLPYMVSVFVGRAVHYMVTALLTFYFGPKLVEFLTHAAMRHSPLILASTAIVAAAFIVYVLHRRKRKRGRISPATSKP